MAIRPPLSNLDRALKAPSPSHPFAEPSSPGGQGLWLVRKPGAAPLGFIVRRSDVMAARDYDCYAYCRDDTNKRPWLRTFLTLNSAAAWMLQNEIRILQLIGRSAPESAPWPPSAH
jgi:hypothetical protein